MLNFARMAATGVGLAGIDGVWWRPAASPFVLPEQLRDELVDAGAAFFALFDVAAQAYAYAPGVRALLGSCVPEAIPRDMSAAPVLSLRPDFQLVADAAGGIRLVATELEVCPSAQGVASVLQTGYGLANDLVEAMCSLLDGRRLRIVMASAWSEFMWDQLVFCAALEAVGGRARLMFDIPTAQLCDEVARGERWVPPMFGIPSRPQAWDGDVRARLRRHGFERLIDPSEPTRDDVVFRFGYSDTFSRGWWRLFNEWRVRGVAFLNPPAFVLDSKVLMALIHEPDVRTLLSPDTIATLERVLPETRLLDAPTAARIGGEREDWVLKFAGFDSGQQAWGGRSLQVGAALSASAWQATLGRYLELPFPCVAQRSAPSAKVTLEWIDGSRRQKFRGRTRLRSFLIRIGSTGEVRACGTHLTVADSGHGVSESVTAVQAPVVFGKVKT